MASGPGFAWRTAYAAIKEAGEQIKREAADAVAKAARAAALEAGPRYPVYARRSTRWPKPTSLPYGQSPGQLRTGVTAAQQSQFRWKVTQAHRYANFVEGTPRGARATSSGRNRGAMTPTPVMGVVGPKWRQAMWWDYVIPSWFRPTTPSCWRIKARRKR